MAESQPTHRQKPGSASKAARTRDCSNPCVYIDTEHWLRTHGRPPAPKLGAEQLAQLTESFKLIDSDGGGTVDAGELGAALTLLGVKAGKAELLAMLERAGVDETAELNPGQFNRVMTEVLTKKPSLKNSPSNPHGQVEAEDESSVASCLKFETTASIYRRKKLMQALIERDHTTLETLTASATDTHAELNTTVT